MNTKIRSQLLSKGTYESAAQSDGYEPMEVSEHNIYDTDPSTSAGSFPGAENVNVLAWPPARLSDS